MKKYHICEDISEAVILFKPMILSGFEKGGDFAEGKAPVVGAQETMQGPEATLVRVRGAHWR